MGTLDDWERWIVGGALVLLAAGVVLMFWALFWDRARGRRRCPKCWYDMAGARGLLCPECGRDARRESRLLKTRRRWRWVAAAAVLFLASASMWGWIRYRRDGPEWWAAHVPTVLIIALLPEAGTPPMPDPKTGTLTPVIWEREMARRAAAGKLRDWHWRWAIERTRVFRTREVWPLNTPVHVGVWPPSWIGGKIEAVPRLDGMKSLRRWSGLSWSGTFEHYHVAMERDQLLGLLPEGQHILEFDVAINLVGWIPLFTSPSSPPPRVESWKGTVRMPIRLVPAEQLVMMAATGKALDGAAKRAIGISWHALLGNATISLVVDRSDTRELDGIALGCIIDIVRDGEVVESLWFWPEGAAESQGSYMNHGRSEVLSELPREQMLSGRWSMRVCGDYVASLREFDCDRYWAGQFEVPLEEVVVPR